MLLPSDKGRIIEQAKFSCSPLGKVLKKQIKTIKDQGENQIKASENRVKKQFLDKDQKSITNLFSRDFLNWRSHIWIIQKCENRK